MAPVLQSQGPAREHIYNVDQSAIVPSHPVTRHLSHVSPHYGGAPYEGSEMLRYQNDHIINNRKRSLPDDFTYDGFHNPLEMQSGVQLTPTHSMQYAYSLPSQRASPTHQHSALYHMQHHHHHRLPNQPPMSKYPRVATDIDEDHGPPSVVGQPGMPEPAPKPKGPKLKFTSDDDSLLVELKETKNLTWKQIADFFPGRSSGTLQVRYCTKLKAKTTIWTDDMVNKLQAAMDEYENDRWRVISSKVGNGFSASACKEKAIELDEEAECATIDRRDAEEDASPSDHGPDMAYPTSPTSLDDAQLAHDYVPVADLSPPASPMCTVPPSNPYRTSQQGSVASVSRFNREQQRDSEDGSPSMPTTQPYAVAPSAAAVFFPTQMSHPAAPYYYGASPSQNYDVLVAS